MFEKRDWDDPQYKAWRKAVRKRDHYSCQMPGCNARRRLQVHHIASWAHNPDLRYEVNNGITLCRQHHDQVNGSEPLYAPMFHRIIAENKTTPRSKKPSAATRCRIDMLFRKYGQEKSGGEE